MRVKLLQPLHPVAPTTSSLSPQESYGGIVEQQYLAIRWERIMWYSGARKDMHVPVPVWFVGSSRHVLSTKHTVTTKSIGCWSMLENLCMATRVGHKPM